MRNDDRSVTDLIPTNEAAKLRGVSVATINRWAKDGTLPVAAKGPGLRGPNLFNRSDVEALREAGAA